MFLFGGNVYTLKNNSAIKNAIIYHWINLQLIKNRVPNFGIPNTQDTRISKLFL